MVYVVTINGQVVDAEVCYDPARKTTYVQVITQSRTQPACRNCGGPVSVFMGKTSRCDYCRT